MDISLVLAIVSALGAGGVFLIRATGHIMERYERLQDRLTVEEMMRKTEDESLKKEIYYKMELESQRHTMNSDRISEALYNLERSLKALHERFDKMICRDKDD